MRRDPADAPATPLALYIVKAIDRWMMAGRPCTVLDTLTALEQVRHHLTEASLRSFHKEERR